MFKAVVFQLKQRIDRQFGGHGRVGFYPTGIEKQGGRDIQFVEQADDADVHGIARPAAAGVQGQGHPGAAVLGRRETGIYAGQIASPGRGFYARKAQANEPVFFLRRRIAVGL